jgi:hypothetical protein
MLDQVPAPVRHAVLVLIGTLLVWAQSALPGTDTLPSPVKAVVATLVTLALAYLTPLVNQYGVSSDAAQRRP